MKSLPVIKELGGILKEIFTQVKSGDLKNMKMPQEKEVIILIVFLVVVFISTLIFIGTNM